MKSLRAGLLVLALPFTTASMCQSMDVSDVVEPKLSDGSPITVANAGPDGGDCGYKVWGQTYRTQSVLSPTTTDARMMSACTDGKGKSAEYPVAIAGTDAYERSGFKQVAEPLTHLGSAFLLGPLAAMLTPDPSDNIDSDFAVNADGSAAVGDVSAAANASALAQQQQLQLQWQKMMQKQWQQQRFNYGHYGKKRPCETSGGHC